MAKHRRADFYAQMFSEPRPERAKIDFYAHLGVKIDLRLKKECNRDWLSDAKHYDLVTGTPVRKRKGPRPWIQCCHVFLPPVTPTYRDELCCSKWSDEAEYMYASTESARELSTNEQITENATD
eukprot:scaffold2282_cov77-Skeletonema_dohrnii-CCMP3373.AAC.2